MRHFTILMLAILLLIFSNVAVTYSEEKKSVEQCERYKIYVVEKLNTVVPSSDSGYIPLTVTGTNNNYLMIDTITGKTWILINIGSNSKNENGKDLTFSSFAWEPLFFKSDTKPLWSKGLSITPK